MTAAAEVPSHTIVLDAEGATALSTEWLSAVLGAPVTGIEVTERLETSWRKVRRSSPHVARTRWSKPHRHSTNSHRFTRRRRCPKGWVS